MSKSKIPQPILLKELKPVLNKKSGRIMRFCRYQCFCGNTYDAFYFDVRYKFKRTCGCIDYEKLDNGRISHGLTSHPLYYIWACMKQRCYNKKNINYKNYGGRGILICREWKESFKSFFDWSLINGWEQGLEIDRKDNDKEYSPANCRFVTQQVNKKNKRARSHKIEITYNRKTQSLKEWSSELGIPYATLYSRIFTLNKSIEDILKMNKKDLIDNEYCLKIRAIIKNNGLKQRWVVQKLNTAGILITEPQFSDKIKGIQPFTEQERSAIDSILTPFE